MLLALIPFGVGMCLGGIGYYRQEHFGNDDVYVSILGLGFGLCVIMFMGVILFRCLSLPRCPECRRKMVSDRVIEIDRADWRVIHCPCCSTYYRVHRLSSR